MGSVGFPWCWRKVRRWAWCSLATFNQKQNREPKQTIHKVSYRMNCSKHRTQSLLLLRGIFYAFSNVHSAMIILDSSPVFNAMLQSCSHHSEVVWQPIFIALWCDPALCQHSAVAARCQVQPHCDIALCQPKALYRALPHYVGPVAHYIPGVKPTIYQDIVETGKRQGQAGVQQCIQRPVKQEAV